MAHLKIEKRKRRTEDYACDQDRRVQAVRAKYGDGPIWNNNLKHHMTGTFNTAEFISKIPVDIMHEHVCAGYNGFNDFIFKRNYRGHTPDLDWISKTDTYKRASGLWIEREVQRAIDDLVPIQTLREYRLRDIPLAIVVRPMYPCISRPIKPVSLPYDHTVLVQQVFSKSACVRMISTTDQKDNGDADMTLSDAWDIVAGPIWTRRTYIESSKNWRERDMPLNFQQAFSTIMLGAETQRKLKIIRRDDNTFSLRLACIQDGEGGRAIDFCFSSTTITQHSALVDSVDFPAGVHSCIAGYLS
jgi:hypothetical protein